MGIRIIFSKSIVEAHHGTIEVESAEGKGTSFIVKLPIIGVGKVAALRDRG
jgi:signal transduction histidine kinase